MDNQRENKKENLTGIFPLFNTDFFYDSFLRCNTIQLQKG